MKGYYIVGYTSRDRDYKDCFIFLSKEKAMKRMNLLQKEDDKDDGIYKYAIESIEIIE